MHVYRYFYYIFYTYLSIFSAQSRRSMKRFQTLCFNIRLYVYEVLIEHSASLLALRMGCFRREKKNFSIFLFLLPVDSRNFLLYCKPLKLHTRFFGRSFNIYVLQLISNTHSLMFPNNLHLMPNKYTFPPITCNAFWCISRREHRVHHGKGNNNIMRRLMVWWWRRCKSHTNTHTQCKRIYNKMNLMKKILWNVEKSKRSNVNNRKQQNKSINNYCVWMNVRRKFLLFLKHDI